MTEASRTWWIVLRRNSIRELTAALYDDQGRQRYVLNGAEEDVLVADVAGRADPTVDVSVAHGWDQAPEALRVKYGPGAKRHR